MQNDTKHESPRERLYPRILDQEPHQSRKACFLTKNRLFMGEDDLPEWMTHGCAVLCQKDPQKDNTAGNYRLIICLPLMWKLLAGVIA